MNVEQKKENAVCHVAEASKLIGDFWTILIVRELLKGCKRFNELQDSVEGVSNSTLSDRLKVLAENQIVRREQYQSIPPKVEYSLTDKGLALENLIQEVENFGRNWID